MELEVLPVVHGVGQRTSLFFFELGHPWLIALDGRLCAKRHESILLIHAPQRIKSLPLRDQTLNKKFITSPSLTTYSLPSERILPASLAPCSPLRAMKSSKAIV